MSELPLDYIQYHDGREMNLETLEHISELRTTPRIEDLKAAMLRVRRRLSIEQARIITESYRRTEGMQRILQRTHSFADACDRISIRIDPGELIAGNRTAGIRAGVVFPEAGLSWLDREIENLPTREQDTFEVDPEDIAVFRSEVLPYWRGRTMEDAIYGEIGDELASISKVVKINQKDHAQGHICPDVAKWLRLGPAGIGIEVCEKLEELTALGARADTSVLDFYRSLGVSLDASRRFMRRYASLARELTASPAPAFSGAQCLEDLRNIARMCDALADRPPESFHEALQSTWFLFVLLHLESNASSFSPGRLDQHLYPYFHADLHRGAIDLQQALELIDAFYLKLNQIVYLRNAESARYFAGFPIGFNVVIGGQKIGSNGRIEDAANELSFLFLKALDHIRLPQPNLSARLFAGSSREFLDECTRLIGLGTGMPQVFNDESIIPALESRGITHYDAVGYAVVGCVELSSSGSMLGFSDAAMFNLVKALELALNDGICMITNRPLGVRSGKLTNFDSYEALEFSFRGQIDHFIGRMIRACETVDRAHAEYLPSPFLSCVIEECIEKGIDVTAGGARYNFSGIQAIQPANVADSLAAIKQMVFDEKKISREALLAALRADFKDTETLRQSLLHKVPKYGNDVEWVDRIGEKWAGYFAERLSAHTNIRGGLYHMGLYTVSAHVPMGKNVAATTDGRRSGEPLADGGLSAMYGRDLAGPTALLNSVSRIASGNASNGTLLNMKFRPSFFATAENRRKFTDLLKSFVHLPIHHVQFNVVSQEELIAARRNPEAYRSLLVRVAGYTAHFTELADDLQDEIIARTEYTSDEYSGTRNE
jgi:pyruvate formate-lyase/glycerol dehydratase family glycyl radical enzyme